MPRGVYRNPKERAEKISKALLKFYSLPGKKNRMFGKKHSAITKRKISEGNKGKKLSEETKKKISEAHQGRHLSKKHKKKISEGNKGKKKSPLTEEWKRKISITLTGNIPWNKGKRKIYSSETIGKMSKAKRGQIPWNKGKKFPYKPRYDLRGHHFSDGEKHWNWKGGITKENVKIRKSREHCLWRKAVFARDNWTCQKYNIKGGKLYPHHIQNFAQFPELRFAIDNGITLSEKAHRKFHKIYGIKNNTKEQLEHFLGLS